MTVKYGIRFMNVHECSIQDAEKKVKRCQIEQKSDYPISSWNLNFSQNMEHGTCQSGKARGAKIQFKIHFSPPQIWSIRDVTWLKSKVTNFDASKEDFNIRSGSIPLIHVSKSVLCSTERIKLICEDSNTLIIRIPIITDDSSLIIQ